MNCNQYYYFKMMFYVYKGMCYIKHATMVSNTIPTVDCLYRPRGNPKAGHKLLMPESKELLKK